MEISQENPSSAQTPELNRLPRVLGLNGPDETTGPHELDFNNANQAEEEYSFGVGDFVWCKLKNRPWWPGQIYDPCDASKDVARFHRRDRTLIALFGKGMSVAWCYPFQLRPFQACFGTLSKQGSLTGNDCISFYTAVEEACGEIRRRVQLEMMCHCVPPETRITLARPVTMNSGLRDGALVPQGVLPMREYDPSNFLLRLKCIAQIASEPTVYELTTFRSQLMAFYCVRGDNRLPVHPGLLEAIDQEENVIADTNDIRTEDLFGESPEQDCTSSPLSPELHQKKKRRRICQGSESVSRKRKKSKNLKGGVDVDFAEIGSDNSISALSKEQSQSNHSGFPPAAVAGKNIAKASTNKASKTGTFSRERKKSRYLSPPYTSLGKDDKSLISLINTETDSPEVLKHFIRCSEGMSRKEPHSNDLQLKKIALKVANVDTVELLTDFCSSAVDAFYMKETKMYGLIQSFFRQLRCYTNSSDPDIFSELLTVSVGQKPSLDNTPDSLEKKMHESNQPMSENMGEGTKRKRKKQMILESKAANSVGGKTSCDMQYNEEASSVTVPVEYTPVMKMMKMADHPISECVVEGKKMKRKKDKLASLESNGCSADEMAMSSVVANRDLTCLNFAPVEKMYGPNHPVSNGNTEGNGSRNMEGSNENFSATLLLKFAAGVPLPTKDSLLTIFRKFGDLNELDTRILKDSACAQVVYITSCDAEEAFSSLQENSPFDTATESYLIQHGSATCKGSTQDINCLSLPATNSNKSRRKRKSAQCLPFASIKGQSSQSSPAARDREYLTVPLVKAGGSSMQLSIVPPPPSGEAPPLHHVRENLEKMTSMLEKSKDDISPQVRAKLEAEIKILHKKVTALVESPPSL